MSSYKCDVCHHIYAPEQGDPLRGVAAGTPIEELPADWTCPVCGVSVSSFREIFEEEPLSMNSKNAKEEEGEPCI